LRKYVAQPRHAFIGQNANNLKKLFILERIDDNIFKDLEDEYMYYLEIPREISWSLFRKITSSVINNIDNSNFDAARAYIYFDGITDFVRIYTRNPSMKPYY